MNQMSPTAKGVLQQPGHLILRHIAREFGLGLNELRSARRARSVARPRQVAWFIMRRLTTMSLPEMGRLVGGRDHSTVSNGLETIEAWMFQDPGLKARVERLERECHELLELRPIEQRVSMAVEGYMSTLIERAVAVDPVGAHTAIAIALEGVIRKAAAREAAKAAKAAEEAKS